MAVESMVLAAAVEAVALAVSVKGTGLTLEGKAGLVAAPHDLQGHCSGVRSWLHKSIVSRIASLNELGRSLCTHVYYYKHLKGPTQYRVTRKVKR